MACPSTHRHHCCIPMPRLLLLLPTTTYRTAAFVEAARQMGVELTVASEQPSTLAAANPAGFLTIDFEQPERAADSALRVAKPGRGSRRHRASDRLSMCAETGPPFGFAWSDARR